MKTHRNIPFFIPHAGCPCRCVFCSQGKITGKGVREKPLDDEIKELETLLESANAVSDGQKSQLAFFGGSFTAIDRVRMITLLETANRYIASGLVSSIRISTRPDCIDGEILEILAHYNVTDIELGVQSVSDEVLEASGRCCTAADCEKGCAEVASDGRFTLGGQMMVGLPCSTAEDEVNTARAIVRFGAKEARIYPTAVFEGTELYGMTLSGNYTPLTNEQAIERSAACAEIFIQNNVKLLRMGLHSGDELAKAPFGATHPAIGEKILARVYRNAIEARLNESSRGKTVCVTVPRGDISKLTGHGGEVKEYLINKYMLAGLTVREGDLPYMTPLVEVKE